MKTKLIELLETFGYPVMLQGSMAEDAKYPDHFFTFWNNETPSNSHYDNDATSYVWNFDVNFYSNNPVIVNTKLDEVRRLLKTNGFVVTGKGHDIVSDEPTHTGRGITVLYLESEV